MSLHSAAFAHGAHGGETITDDRQRVTERKAVQIGPASYAGPAANRDGGWSPAAIAAGPSSAVFAKNRPLAVKAIFIATTGGTMIEMANPGVILAFTYGG